MNTGLSHFLKLAPKKLFHRLILQIKLINALQQDLFALDGFYVARRTNT